MKRPPNTATTSALWMVLLSAIAATAPAQSQQVDVTGTWLFEVQTSGGSGSPTFSFKQDGEQLTGRYHGQFGEAEVRGTVKGTAISFSFEVVVQGTAITVTYSGTVEKDTMRGKVNYGDVAQGTFTAKRKS